jgi:glycosyltransferase involved in cell wall biosynthesis
LLENITVPRSSGVFCNSAYTEALVRSRNPRTWRVPNAVRLPFFAPIPDRFPNERPRLINVGVIGARKRQVELLKLGKRLHEQGHRFVMEFIGKLDSTEPYGREFAEAIGPASKQGYAVYSGTKDVQALIKTLDQSDGCIHFPSEEAFGLIVPEALSRNLKFFGAREGGITDIAEAVEGAELFGPEDWAGLEAGLVRWLQAGAPRPHQAAPAMALRYHPSVVAKRHLEIYREVLKQTPPAV